MPLTLGGILVSLKSMTKLPLTSMVSGLVMSDFHSSLGLEISCKKTMLTSAQGMEEFHGFADLSPLWLQIFHLYRPLKLDVSIEEITALLLRDYCILTLQIV